MRRILRQRDFGRGLDRAEHLHTLGWGLFLAWGGVAAWCALDWCIGLFGAAAITLGVQAARKGFGLGADGFWIAVGVVLTAAAGWDFLEIPLRLPVVAWILGTEAVVLLLVLLGIRDLAGLSHNRH